MVRCSFCKGEISETAGTCRHCGRPTHLIGSEPALGCGPWGVAAAIVVAVVAAFFILVAIGSRTPADEVERCVRNKANGAWTASTGVSLRRFCESAVNLRDMQRDRQAHPEHY